MCWPWLREPDASSSTVFGAGAQDPGMGTVYDAKLAEAQEPCDLRPKALSSPRESLTAHVLAFVSAAWCVPPPPPISRPPPPALPWGDIPRQHLTSVMSRLCPSVALHQDLPWSSSGRKEG